ncbi:hypothetical protein [Muribaculum intestinale]|uniref:hypothetical protein n=1 Tax=Muribaculum intestinale TaxID=1796646 RepID=UPI00241F4E7D|nr:hypothetical protein [Muribaculum intestinale]
MAKLQTLFHKPVPYRQILHITPLDPIRRMAQGPQPRHPIAPMPPSTSDNPPKPP